jgi:hypothetical protein
VALDNFVWLSLRESHMRGHGKYRVQESRATLVRTWGPRGELWALRVYYRDTTFRSRGPAKLVASAQWIDEHDPAND